MFRIFLVLLSIVVMQGSSPQKFLLLKEIGEDTEIPDTGEYVYIFSPGGIIYRAYQLAPKVQNKTCIVFAAASVAAMIILPACKERYFVKNARFGFHNANMYLPPFNTLPIMISQWDAEEIVKVLSEENDKMLDFMIDHGVPFSREWLKIQMKNNTTLVGEALKYWHPWLKPVTECGHCGPWVKMIDMNNVSTLPQN